MSDYATMPLYIGPVGQLFGRPCSNAQLDADTRDIRRILLSVGEGYFLPDVSLNVPSLIDKRLCLAHRTDGQLDGVIFYENVDVTHSPYTSGNDATFRVTALRSLAIKQNARRQYIAYRLVREAQLRGAVFSPHGSPNGPLRSSACLASIHANNFAAINLANRMGATIGSTDSAVVDHHLPIRAYAVGSHEKAYLFDKKADFVIAVLRSTDLHQAAHLHRLGTLNGATDEGSSKVTVTYDPGDVKYDPGDVLKGFLTSPDLLTSAVSGLLRNDRIWLNRFGLEDGPDTQGLGTVHYGRITNEMLLSKAS